MKQSVRRSREHGGKLPRQVHRVANAGVHPLGANRTVDVRGVAEEKRAPAEEDLTPPKVPVRAAIYIGPDGTVRFGALFEDLVPVARALGLEAKLPGPHEGKK